MYQNSMCMLCIDRDETINHIISEYSKLALVLENNTHKLLWDFDVHTDHLISTRRPDLIITNNKKRELAKLLTLLSGLTTE